MANSSQSLSSLISESRGILRRLVRRPGYPIAAWVMLGLAVAANAAVFAIVYGFMLKPLPYAQPDQLSVVRERLPGIGLNTPLVSVKTYLALKRDLGDVASVGLSTHAGNDVVKIGGQPHLLNFTRVTTSLMRTLGVSPLVGRLPAADADQPGGPNEMVISRKLWQSAYGGNRDVLGRSLKVDGTAYRIVGVMPNDFFATEGGDAWLPYVMTPKRAQNQNINYWMIVRRKPGVSLHQLNLALANERVRLLEQKTAKERASEEKSGYTIDARPLRAVALNEFGIGQLPWLLQAAAGLLLLLALANTVNLGLVRQRGRQHEFALRRVLGASRGALVRLILSEHLPLVLAVGATATLLAWASLSALHAFGLPPSDSPFHVTLGSSVIAFTWVLALLSILVVACGPAVLATGRRLIRTLGHGPTATGGKTPRHLQRALGTVQIALACALVIAGGLLGASLWHVLSQSVGFKTHERIAATVVLPHTIQNETAAWATLKPQLLKIPGVRDATVTGMTPFSGNYVQGGVRSMSQNSNLIVNMPPVGDGFFSTLGIPLVAGRAFTANEIAQKAHVTVINEALARKFYGGARQAIGQTLKGGMRIIGVAHNIAWAPTPDQYDSGTAYLPFGAISTGFTVIVRKSVSSAPLAGTLKKTILTALPGSIVFSLQSMNDMVRGASVFRAAGAGMVGAFAALALLLAALGVFAITSFIARSHLNDYGIRAAIGATPAMLLRLGFNEATWLLAIGIPVGLAGAYLLGRAIASALYQTSVFNPGLYLAGIAIIATVVFVAAWGPARRAARTPVRKLMSEIMR